MARKMKDVFDSLLREDMGAGTMQMFSLELPGTQRTYVVMAKRKESAIVSLAGVVGKENLLKNRHLIQSHFSDVVQVNHGTDDVTDMTDDAEEDEADDIDIKKTPPTPPVESRSYGGLVSLPALREVFEFREAAPPSAKAAPAECPLCGESMPCEEHMEQNRDHGVTEAEDGQGRPKDAHSWAEQTPKVSQQVAKKLMKAHGAADVEADWKDFLGDNPDQNGKPEVDSLKLIEFLGY